MDEIGLITLCWIYHLQLCVHFKNHYWCSLNRADVVPSKIILAFCGKLGFMYTRKHGEKTKTEQYYLHARKTMDTIQCPTRRIPDGNTPGPSKPPTPKKSSIPPRPRPARPTRPKPVKMKPGTTPKPAKLVPKPTLQVTTHGVLKCQPKLCAYKCPAGCKTVSKSEEFKTHVWVKHPTFHFKCKFCAGEYWTYNAKFKHEWSHKLCCLYAHLKGAEKHY